MPNLLLYSIAFSHYNEKVRWAFSYYNVPYTHHLTLPAPHILSLKPLVKAGVAIPRKEKQNEEVSSSSSEKSSSPSSSPSPYSTPCLAIYDDGDDDQKRNQSKDSFTNLKSSIHDSHDILLYLSENYSSSSSSSSSSSHTNPSPNQCSRPNLYTSCGTSPTKIAQITSLEHRFGSGLGVAARQFAYYNLLVLNRWKLGAMFSFATLGFRNSVGVLQSLVWLLFSPVLARLLARVMRLGGKEGQEVYERAMSLVREEFEYASKLLEKSPYLAGDRLSAADITFAALSYPILGITHEEGFQQYSIGPKAFSTQGKGFQAEMRNTRAGRHVVRLFREERYFEDGGRGVSPKQRRMLGGLW